MFDKFIKFISRWCRSYALAVLLCIYHLPVLVLPECHQVPRLCGILASAKACQHVLYVCMIRR